MSPRADDEPWTLEGVADPLEVRRVPPPPTDHHDEPLPARSDTSDPRPPKGGVPLASPRLLLLVPWVLLAVGFAYAALTGDGGAADSTEAVENRLLFGGCALFFAVLALYVLRHRVVLHGRFLHHRTLVWRSPVDLERLASARLEPLATKSGPNSPITITVRVLVLRDHDGRRLMVDRANGDLEPLYRELGRRFDAGDPVFDERVAAKVDRLRDAPAT
jgi:hypothetical protein